MAEKILRLPEVVARTGLSRSTIYVRIKAGNFPQPISIGTRAIGFVESEIAKWIEDRVQASRQKVRNHPVSG